MTLENEHLFPRIFHDVLAQILNKKPNCDRFAIFLLEWHFDFVGLLVGEEHFETAACVMMLVNLRAGVEGRHTRTRLLLGAFWKSFCDKYMSSGGV